MPEATDNSAIRLDKWLWAARFYKTRALARSMIEGGKVHYNGQRSKPGKLVEVGAMLRIRQGQDEKQARHDVLRAPDKPFTPPAARWMSQMPSTSIMSY